MQTRIFTGHLFYRFSTGASKKSKEYTAGHPSPEHTLELPVCFTGNGKVYPNAAALGH